MNEYEVHADDLDTRATRLRNIGDEYAAPRQSPLTWDNDPLFDSWNRAWSEYEVEAHRVSTELGTTNLAGTGDGLARVSGNQRNTESLNTHQS